MISIPSNVGEILQQAHLVDADSTSLLRRLVAAVEEHFDGEDSESGEVAQSKEPGEDGSTDEYEDGWRHGLEAALSLIQMAEAEVHDGQQKGETRCERGAKVTLDCIGRAIELAMLEDSTDTGSDFLGLSGKLKKASSKRAARKPAERECKPQPTAKKSTQTPAVKPTTRTMPTGSGGKHQRAIVEFLQSKPERKATRTAIRKHLVETRATSTRGAYAPIDRAIASNLVEDLGDDLIGLPQA